MVVEHETSCPSALLGSWLGDVGVELDIRRPYAGDPLPADLADHDLYLVLGGAMGAHDDAVAPWLEPTRALVRRAATDGVPTLGICLGHQLCAVALGGTAARNPGGRWLGVRPVGWLPSAAADPLLGGLTGATRAAYYNDDVVTVLPRGAVELAASDAGEPQAVRFAPSVWGIQPHPEVDAAGFTTWATEVDDRAVETAAAEVATHAADLERSWRPLGAALVALAAGVRR